jgi:hypothetical protein
VLGSTAAPTVTVVITMPIAGANFDTNHGALPYLSLSMSINENLSKHLRGHNDFMQVVGDS